ncbi:Bug family tripartite tricarboxylate transporter substrate binding protein [Cupriavidus consociatus]|uniref:Bug family tripartite tricarboxylate transporter substrate binding protein n=1 Tax=Cupriavidus consociatus TaxID=2821357 RepID=UPI001AE9A43C|nr:MULTISPECIES: tripartite tricarboxylate transporter substrate binding protein [unclassified Cupriavidus]MBP0623151.1 tripartite tricarboxylate transporter substrate binding protein [Cupriavidus sp. LEh25]MDK2659845.1 tripartite tricarboxylate transporter substrate binding protein [Cupriavidus sp. LEh21]
MKRRHLMVAAALLACGPFALAADPYPVRPIKIIAPQPPGGAVDMMARTVAEALQKTFGQAVVVENKSGAGGLIGVSAAAKSPADGYTLVIGSTGPFSVSASLLQRVPFDPVKDFVPIARLAQMPSYLVVNANVPVSTVTEFLALVRSKPGRFTYASTGNGLSQHTNMELLKSIANLSILPVTYRGSAPAISDLLGHQVDMMIELGPQVIPHIRAGKLKVLATTSATRTELLPKVPTLAESGVPGFEAYTWFALYAPAGTPQAIVSKVHEALTKEFDGPEIRTRLSAIGAEVALNSPTELAAFQAAETKKWAAVIRQAGIKPE